MRQCIFVVGTRPELISIAPMLQAAGKSGLRHTVWLTGQEPEPIDDVISDFSLKSIFVYPRKPIWRSRIGKFLFWFPPTLYRCFHYINGVKSWTGKRPLVVVHGDTQSALLGAVAGKWGGGDPVNLDSRLGSGNLFNPFRQESRRRMIHKRTRYAFCRDNESAARMRRYPGCIVEVGPSTVEKLLRWSGSSDQRGSA